LNSVAQSITRMVHRARRRYSVMVMSGPDGRLRQFSLPGVLLPLAAGLAVLGAVGGGAVVLGWASERVERSHLANLQHENRRLEKQLTDIRSTVEQFEKRMAGNLEMEQVFRNLANLDAIPEDVQRLGVGGPPAFSELEDLSSPSPLVREARQVLDQLEELNRQAVFEATNLEEVVDVLGKNQDELAHIPSISPLRRGWFSSGYGIRTDPFTNKPTMHPGLDFASWTGTPVYATADGKVVKAGKNGTLGNMVEIDHGNGIRTRYGHNSKILVKVGEVVTRGQKIAEVGNTGRSTSPHCHYEVHVKGRHTNPWRYILDGGPRVNGTP
jgi:Peptidase family M23